MRETPDSLSYGKYLPDVYRFAFLMTASADTAAEVLRQTVRRAARGGLNDIRDPLRAKRWLFAEARTLCGRLPGAPARGDVPLAPAPPSLATEFAAPSGGIPEVDVPALPPEDPPHQLAMLFADLSEDERAALILFYLFLFDPAELAELLEIKPAELGPLLLRGRLGLQRHGIRYETLFAAAEPASAVAVDA